MTAPALSTRVDSPAATRTQRVALVGNPNTGKTTLFNRLCGVRARTANFPGSTVDARVGTCLRGATRFEVVDLPGTYSLELDLPEARLCRECLEGRLVACEPDAVLVVLDATNLRRNLQFAAAVLRRGKPTVVALNMVDLAARKGLSIDVEKLSARLGCRVIATKALSGAGVDDVIEALGTAQSPAVELPLPGPAVGAWADEAFAHSVGGDHALGGRSDTFTDRLDLAFTHPVLGLAVFIAVMASLFATIFWLADLPMAMIESIFFGAGAWISAHLPPGPIAELLADGVVAGVGGVVVFLPQICLLFFLLALLEDTGYLARASFVMDRIMARFGLPGQSFVPLLSSHACALPGIMATRLIPDRNERLATILVAPFMSCSARIPVYVLLIGLLFGDRPLIAGLAFAGCYMLGAAAAMVSALIARRTILPGRSRPMVLELPSYKRPSLRTALLTTIDRARLFLRNAGTVILAISIVMWWLSAYPRSDAPPEAESLRQTAERMASAGAAPAVDSADDAVSAESLRAEADAIERRHQQMNSFAGRIGNVAQPLFAPFGADRQITVAILTSFLAREVFQGTMIILVGVDDEADQDRILTGMRNARRDDGRPLFDDATAAGLLVFFVLAMQCLPTVALVRREAGGWGWAALQFFWMSGLAWIAGVATYWCVTAFTG